MSGSIPIVLGNAHIKREKVAGVTKFRWYCSCVRSNTFPAQPRSGQWHRQVLTVIESFRQHWDAVHKGHELSDWDFMMNRAVVWAVGDIAEDDAAGYWVAPSGKRPAVAEDYYAAKKDMFAQLYGAKATVRITNLTTGATSTVTGASVSFDATLAEEKKGMSRLSDIEARMRELEKEAARYQRFSKTDPWPVGTVITYNWSPMPNDAAEVYTYAVLKAANGEWYWTGAARNRGSMHGGYDMLVEHLASDNVSDIAVALPDDFKPLFPESVADVIGEEAAAKVDEFLANPETGVRMERPARREGGTFVPVVKGSEK